MPDKTFNPQGDGGKRARSPGRARRKPLKPLRAGTPGDSGVLVYSRAFYQCKAHARLRVPRASGVPHALFGREIYQRLGRMARRGREGVFGRHCELTGRRIRATRWHRREHAAPGPGHERNLLSPLSSDLPVGRLVDRAVESFISDFPKNISVPTYPKSILELSPSHPTTGAYRDRHGRGVRMRWTRQRWACDASAGRIALRERLAACKTTALLADGEVVWS